ncbi:NAD(P)H-binding protein [Runella sp. MFBS21]|uniref:NAD(P)H-binding protein n=1 Tax=Runella sp. MFBS21 TaxID=3034018 RepID=UPI0023F92C00|nr:NAD(P)H-binding protein [Runella sp. MFBS21]MDF7820622.1 NAD(P)H-binding protein [Runella sp. MFBS21]
MKAVIIGATGATGKELLQLLMASKDVSEIVALVRKPLPIKHPKLNTIVVDFGKLSDWKKHISGDVAFSCLGTTLRAAGSQKAQYVVDYEYQYEFAKLAKDNHIPTFILISSSTANPKSLIFYSRMKGELEKSVEALGFKNVVVFRPGPLIRPETDRTGEKIGVTVISFLNKVGLFCKMAPLEVKDLATLMLRYATKPPLIYTILESGRILEEARK